MVLPFQLYYLIAGKKISSKCDSNSASPFFGLIDLFLYSTFFVKIQKLFSTFRFFLLCQLFNSGDDSEVKGSEDHISEADFISHQENNESSIIDRDEVKMLMEKLGIFCSSESEGELEEKYGSKELSELFEEEEPSLEEVKMAFDVFDENKDGFIDAKELQRVFRILGFKEASQVDNCHKMIRNFDENQDGRIDFIEFVKIMENRLCSFV